MCAIARLGSLNEENHSLSPGVADVAAAGTRCLSVVALLPIDRTAPSIASAGKIENRLG